MALDKARQKVRDKTPGKTSKPVWHGVVLVAGGAVGAGMFALPMVSAGAWTLWSFVGLTVVWWFTYLAAKSLVNTNLTVLEAIGHSTSHFTGHSTSVASVDVKGPPTSFDTLVKHVLGPRWATLNNLSLVFIMMILMYAYISAGASILSVNLSQLGLTSADSLSTDQRWLSVLFALVIALLVWFGTALVAKISVALMVVMAISFAVVIWGLVPHLQLNDLFSSQFSLSNFVWAALPVYVTAFACAGLVPSLVNHYRADVDQIKKRKVLASLFWGTLLALSIYMVWLLATFGAIGRAGFEPILQAGGNTGDLVLALGQISSAESAAAAVQLRMTWFSHCAIITSFLSIGLGLFHFVQDKLRLNDNWVDRFKAAAVCFLPPTIASFHYPKGFLVAIGYAGLFVTFSFFVIPALMSLKDNKRRALLVFSFGLLVAALKVLSNFGFLPTLVKI